MKTLSLKLVITIFTIAISQNCIGQYKFSTTEIKEDFKYLYETLETSPYDLYFYTPKSVFDKEYERINKSISDSMSLLEINRLFQSFVVPANISHCSIDFPYSAYQYFYKNGIGFFPLKLILLMINQLCHLIIQTM